MFVCLFVFFLVGLGFEVRALAKQALYCLSHAQVRFALVIFEMGSCKLFAWAGLKPQLSQFQPPK
jgi:hypothetical protein